MNLSQQGKWNGFLQQLINKTSIRTRLIFIIVLLVMLTAFSVVAINVRISFNNGLERAFEQLETVARLKEEGVARWIDHLEEDLVNTLEPKDLRWHMSVLTKPEESLRLFTQISYNRVKVALNETLSRTQRFDELFLINRKGDVVLSTSEVREQEQFSDSVFFHKGGKEFVAQFLFQFPESDGVSIVTAIPVVGKSKEILGILAGRSNVLQLNQIMGSRKGLGKTGETYLLDSKGLLLTPTRFRVSKENKVIDTSTIPIIQNSEHSVRVRNKSYRSSDVISSQHWLSALNVVLIAEQEEVEALSSTYTALKMSLAVTVVALLTAVSLGIFLTRNITEPLDELAKTAAKITAGEIDTVASVRGGTEIMHLADTFNEMTSRLRDLIEQLKRSEQQQMDLLNNTSSVIYIKDLKSRYIFINQMFEDIFNISNSYICGKTDDMFFPQKVAETFQANDLKVIEDNSILEFEEVVPQADGQHTYISVKFPLKKSSGEIYAICGISTDITTRKHQEEELRRLRNYLYNIINSMPSMLIGIDSDGLITQWNNQAKQNSGIDEAAAMGQPLHQILPRLKPEMERVFNAIKTRQEQSDHKRQVMLDGNIHYEDITIFPLITNGIEGAVIRIDDVTERIRIEEMMIQSEKMLSVGGLAAGMAHEINNPLGGIMQTSEVMSERLTGELAANKRAAEKVGIDMEAIHAYMEGRGIPRMLNTIRDSCSRAATIVESMLGFARSGESVFSDCDIAELIEQTLLLSGTDYDLKKRYDFKQIKIVRDYQDDLLLVTCEPQKVQQVLLNIFKNGAQAIQEMNDNRKVGAEEKQPCFTLTLRNELEAKMVRIEISDNGPGMEEEIRKRVFEPFFSTKPVGLGTGLGLSVAYFIITENLSGSLNVKSQLGVGTNFILRLPAAEKGQHE